MDRHSLEVSELGLPGAFLLTPRAVTDEVVVRYETFRQDDVENGTGRPFAIRYSDLSAARRLVLRGIHGSAGEDARPRLFDCVRGSAVHVVVDLRVGSPEYGRHEVLRLDHRDTCGVFVSEGLGHAWLALEDDTVVACHSSLPRTPGSGYTVSALDPALALPWGLTQAPVMSDEDLAAPTAAEALARGLLPAYEACLALHDRPVLTGD
ncbi:dTDP-4-dehydrorhamnose 3,5-epimerase [Streptomyces sp. JB150]|uniref:dTDP-4-dehydrorhamnose 3,5-epimerase n=1 Tax=Streptomyces sp. JB150 TaxID=2714844 RepID=UPI00140E943F|nr:dTDP-4-dehydrorhamnose 3,5-epimerase [Streptomyces sp. JB150]QIJ60625.1 dTDP-4-keto-6-deoxy-D-glucose epimerase [Streptomyces sp. JB150]